MATDFRLLGPLNLTIAGMPVPIRAPKQRALLVTLLWRVNDEVSMEELYHRLWDDRPPAAPSAALHVHVARLRAALGDRSGSGDRPGRPQIRSLGGGYVLHTAPDTVDLFRFRAAAHRALQARQAADAAAELAHVRAALAQWTDGAADGGTIASLTAVTSLAAEAGPSLLEERLRLLERECELALAVSPPAEVVPRLRSLVTLHPLREQLWLLLLSALHRTGDREAAIDAYDRATTTLRTRLGITPGPRLVAEFRRITGDDWHARTDLPPVDTPRTIRGHGWATVASTLLGRGADTGLPVVCLAGPAGADRTAGLVALAHRLHDDFPDGQWYVRLTGPDGRPRDPSTVLARLLRLSGTAPEAVPAARRDLVNTYRARLADRRVLLLLDDARDTEQVRDLLPGTSRSAVVIVGDKVLPELVALYGARSIDPSRREPAGPRDPRLESRQPPVAIGVTAAAESAAPPPPGRPDPPQAQGPARPRNDPGEPAMRR